MALLVAVHLATGAWWVARGHGALDALVWDRGTGMRIAVGGQHVSALSRGEWWRLATSVLLHGDLLHLAVNAVSLLALGRLLEPALGAARWLGWFALGGALASLGSWALGVPQSDGASGGAFALLAGGVVLGLGWRARWAPEDRRLVGPVLLAFLVGNGLLGCVIPGIDAVGHAAGALVGAGLAAVDPVRPGRAWRAGYVAAAGAFAAACAWGWGGG